MWSRREALQALGVASAQAIAWACSAPPRVAQRSREVSPQIHVWLREAVSALRGAGFADAHALAVRRHRITAAIDVLGAGVARATRDALVLSVRERDGTRREHVTGDLSRAGISAAARALAGAARPSFVDFGFMPPIAKPPPPDPHQLSDAGLLARVAAFGKRDRATSSRIVYAAALLDVDDAHVWSVAPGRDLEQRLVRIRKSITRVAWSGTRPVVREAERAWTGGIDDLELTDEDVASADEAVLAHMTPRAFDDGEHSFVLAPEVAARVLDAGARAVLTTQAMRRPEVARRGLQGAFAPGLILVDDPTAPRAYGGFGFDDAGAPAVPLPLIEQGRIVGRIAERCRAGHAGALEARPSHLRLSPGSTELAALLDDGFVLDGPISAFVDPASERVVIAVARAIERKQGRVTGRAFAELELVGQLEPLLASISGMSRETRSVGIRDERDGQPRWTSVETPWLRGRGLLRARRRLL